jgi:site-specific DNA-cytosine methylase
MTIEMHEFSAGFLFCGLGAGALGFIQAASRLGKERALFRNVGGIDNDPEACEDFEYLTGGKATCADIAAMDDVAIRAALGERRPDCIFTSPPCQGLSGLLSTENSQKQHYQDLNMLVLKGLFLICESWPDSPPPTIVLENVPRIQSRGARLLDQARDLLRQYGYVFDMATHDCGEIGGLAQHRKRFLMIARRPENVPGYIYRPPKKRVRGCGEVLGDLPMPEDPGAGELHQLPKLSWLNWVRLALIPAGGDWRDLPKGPVRVEQREDSFKGRPDAYGVQDWDAPSKTVRGKMAIAHSPAAVADPRAFNGRMGVTAWTEPTGTVLGESYPSNGNFSVADPRLTSPVAEGEERRAHFMRYHVAGWDEAVRTVAGSGTNGNYGVADPRLELQHEPRRGTFGVTSWDQPSPAVRGNAEVRQAASAVSDPRLGLTDNPNRHWNKYVITPWTQPAGTVTGATRPGSGAAGVADPRLGCRPRNGYYGVISWQEAAGTITGTARIDNGRFAVADPRKPPPMVPIIEAVDGTWHRPLTTLELAALQGIPARVNDEPLKLAGDNIARWRKRIGNAVPVQAGTAIAATILTALLAGKLGVWTASGGVWVREDGVTEDEANAEFELGELEEAA